MILLFIVLAVIVEALVEYVKTIIVMEDKKAIAIQLSALIVSVTLCLLAGADVFSELGVAFQVPYVGCVLTGVFASRGANYASDLVGRLRSVKQKNTDT